MIFYSYFAVFLVWSLDRVAKLHYLILESENATLLIWLSFIQPMLQKRNIVFFFMPVIILFISWIGLNRVKVQEPLWHTPIQNLWVPPPTPPSRFCTLISIYFHLFSYVLVMKSSSLLPCVWLCLAIRQPFSKWIFRFNKKSCFASLSSEWVFLPPSVQLVELGLYTNIT